MFFENVSYIVEPKKKQKVIFQCDETFFKKYGIYNLISCDKLHQDVHIHFINPSDKFINQISKFQLNIELSISQEFLNVENINFYKLKSYYFCSRYFIADKMFTDDLIDCAYITDADIVFNNKIDLPDVNLGILFYPQYDNLWKRTGANFTLVRKNKKEFLSDVTNEYKSRILSTNFEAIDESMNKLEKAELYGLDQVCMSAVIKNKKYCDFFNLCEITNFISKGPGTQLWSFTGGNQKGNPEFETRLKEIFKTDLDKKFYIT